MVRSTSSNPHLNLAFEEWLFRHGPAHQTRLFLYRNRPCVVVGRNQNPLIECNVPLLQSLGIPVIRRHSGGGTVYHDLGNSCYGVHMPREHFSRDAYAHVVVAALAEVRPGLRVSPRHDLFWSEQKVSGSAYRIVRDRAYHHGTMLLSCDLARLGELLHSPIGEEMRQRGAAISSVVSPVCNIGRLPGLPDLDHDRFCDLLLEAFRQRHGPDRCEVLTVTDDTFEGIEEVVNTAKELQDDSWTFDRSPPYSLNLPRASVNIDHGSITESSDPNLVGQRMTVDLLEQLLLSRLPVKAAAASSQNLL